MSMTEKQKGLISGAIKNAVSAAMGMILSLNIVDPVQFSIRTLGGWRHLGEVILVTVVVSEARYWKQWADSPAVEAPAK
jgi:hypothetical protein